MKPPETVRLAAVPSGVAVPGAAKVEGFVLTSPVVAGGATYPVEFTGDGEGISPPLSWKGVPAGTKSLVLVMHHLDPGGKTRIYRTLYGMGSAVSGLEKNNKETGTPAVLFAAMKDKVLAATNLKVAASRGRAVMD